MARLLANAGNDIDRPHRALLVRLFEAAVAAARPETRLKGFLPAAPKGRTVVVGAGKAAASMAVAVEDAWESEGRASALGGLVITRYGHGLATRHIEVVEAGHPVPDDAGTRAARAIVDLVSTLGEDDQVLCLVSGGGSALLSVPAPGLSLADKRLVTSALLRSGANISEMNCVRKHLSAIKGGRLARHAFPAEIVTLMISDVPNDDVSVIASGPTVPDPTSFAEARAVLAKYSIQPPDAVARFLDAAADETPKPGDRAFDRAGAHIIARPQESLEAAARLAEEAGYRAVILSDSIEGEARDVALVHAAIAQQVVRHGQPAPAPCILLSGGETTVTVRGEGRGGRNVEFLLALALALKGEPAVYGIACDTDGIDGTEDNAGAVMDPGTLARAIARRLDPAAHLADNNAYAVFSRLDDLIVTGPTRTNVNDFRAILIRDSR